MENEKEVKDMTEVSGESEVKAGKIITAPKEAKYLSDIPNFEFPVNCLFNKGKTGCGGTEMVLRANRNTIIAVPYISLIKNKVEKNTEHGDRSDKILGVYGDVKGEKIKKYLETHPVKKIIVTYDSLPRLTKIIQEQITTRKRCLTITFYWWTSGIACLTLMIIDTRPSVNSFLSLPGTNRSRT